MECLEITRWKGLITRRADQGFEEHAIHAPRLVGNLFLQSASLPVINNFYAGTSAVSEISSPYFDANSSIWLVGSVARHSVQATSTVILLQSQGYPRVFSLTD